MTINITEQVVTFCQKYALLVSNSTVVVGVSGGPDSLCLLHLLNSFKPHLPLNLVVAHLNHQLRGIEAQQDAQFVQTIATNWQLPVFLETVDVAALASQHKLSIEEAARQARYAFLWRIAANTGASKIAVGHNADDQTETVLMHILRGTGLSGLRGMLPQVDIASLRLPANLTPSQTGTSPRLIRPLLQTPRADIEAYCQAYQLSPRQDYTNTDTAFFRNRLRHELIPLLETYNPNIRQTLRRTAAVIDADMQLLSRQLDRVWNQIIDNESPEQITFKLSPWLKLPLALKRSTLRRAVYGLKRSLRDISFEHIEQAIDIIETGQTGAKVTLPKNILLQLSYDAIILTTQPDEITANYPSLETGQEIAVNIPGYTLLPNSNWQLCAEILPRQDVLPTTLKNTHGWEAYLDADVVGDTPILRSRRAGDMFCPLGMDGNHKKINQFMINEKIPAATRNRIPLLVSNNKIVWVCGYRPDHHARIQDTTRRVLHLKFLQKVSNLYPTGMIA